MGLGAGSIRLKFQAMSRALALSLTHFVDLRLQLNHARLAPNRDAIAPGLRMHANLSNGSAAALSLTFLRARRR
jgi:hypothetical protein